MRIRRCRELLHTHVFSTEQSVDVRNGHFDASDSSVGELFEKFFDGAHVANRVNPGVGLSSLALGLREARLVAAREE